MFLRIVRARSAEQSGIKGGKRSFDPNIMTLVHTSLESGVVRTITRFTMNRNYKTDRKK